MLVDRVLIILEIKSFGQKFAKYQEFNLNSKNERPLKTSKNIRQNF